MKRQCVACRHCEKSENEDKAIVGRCHWGPPSVTVYTNGATIEFPPVTAPMSCAQHKFRRWSALWLLSLDFLKFWK